jgi:hypothetical protein
MLIYVPLYLRPERTLAYREGRTTDSGDFPFKEAKMFCKSCGRALADTLRFCDGCGADVDGGAGRRRGRMGRSPRTKGRQRPVRPRRERQASVGWQDLQGWSLHLQGLRVRP